MRMCKCGERLDPSGACPNPKCYEINTAPVTVAEDVNQAVRTQQARPANNHRDADDRFPPGTLGW